MYARARIGDRGIIGYQIGGQNRGPKQVPKWVQNGVPIWGSIWRGPKWGANLRGPKSGPF